MTRILFAAAALSLIASPALAGDKAKRSFTRDGITYVYTSSQEDGALVLEGRTQPLGRDFRLVVRNGKVTGYAGGTRVSFRLSDIKRNTQVAQN